MTLKELVVARLTEIGVKDTQTFIRENFGSLSTNVGKDNARDWLAAQNLAQKITEAGKIQDSITDDKEFKPDSIQEFEAAMTKKVVLKMVYRGHQVNLIDLFVINKAVEFSILDMYYVSQSITMTTAWRTAIRLIDDKIDVDIHRETRSYICYYPDSLIAALYDRYDDLEYIRKEMYRRGLMLTMKQSEVGCKP
jgi:hypothetical protein